MTRRRRKLKTRPPRYLLGRWRTREEGAALKGSGDTVPPPAGLEAAPP